ncbi:MAG: ATP-dependent DNA helicase UvrD2 [Candidatus Nanopelagicales bacterium]
MSDLLLGLSAEQQAAARALDGPVLILAGPGSGKTRTITHRIAHGVEEGRFDAPRTLAVTFTTRAAAELHTRLHRLGAGQVAVRTFHSAALRQLRHFWPDAVGGAVPRIEAHRAGLVAAAAERCGLGTRADVVAALTEELDWLKAACLTAAEYVEVAADRTAGGATPAEVARALAEYEVVKSERGVIDFDDVLLVTVGLLSTRSDLRESVRRAFRWITVDEYQDVTPLQQRLLDLWVGERGDICVVGDPAQTIYRFAGADPSLITGFPRRYPAATVVELPTTYRCAPVIADVANRLAVDIPGSLRLQAARTDPAGTVRIRTHPDDRAEVRALADEIGALVSAGHAADEIACLYRIHQYGQPLVAELRRRAIPFSTRGGDRFFDRPEVREALIRYRGELRVHPDLSAREVLELTLTAMGHEPEPPDGSAARERWESLAALQTLFDDELSGREGADLLERRRVDNEPPRAPGVALLTIHAAKGLEWDTVFVVGADDSALPFVRATTDDELAEERRLAYVAFTRARQRLVVSWAMSGPTGAPRSASPYLSALGREVSEPEPVLAPPRVTPPPRPGVDLTGSGQPPARCRRCSRSLVTGRERVLGRCDSCAPESDDALVADLLAWRDRRAQADHVPGHVILTAVTVQAIAETRPATAEQLATIPGMRPQRLADYGSDILRIVAALTPDRGR